MALPRASASEVTFSPSTSRTTGSVTESPTSLATLSISMTSPTATFCCWPPLRTIAYTADSLSSSDYKFNDLVQPRSRYVVRRGAVRAGHTEGARARRGSSLRKSTCPVKTGPADPRPGSALAGALLLDRDVRGGCRASASSVPPGVRRSTRRGPRPPARRTGLDGGPAGRPCVAGAVEGSPGGGGGSAGSAGTARGPARRRAAGGDHGRPRAGGPRARLAAAPAPRPRRRRRVLGRWPIGGPAGRGVGRAASGRRGVPSVR